VIRIAVTVLAIVGLWCALFVTAVIKIQSGACIEAGCGDAMDRNSVFAFGVAIAGAAGHLYWYASRVRRRRS